VGLRGMQFAVSGTTTKPGRLPGADATGCCARLEGGTVAQEPKRTFRSIHPVQGAWPRKPIDGIWAPLVSGALVLLAGGLGLLAGERIWLFASLGPTAYLLAEDPEEPSSRSYNNAIVSHLIANWPVTRRFLPWASHTSRRCSRWGI
jgi:hypothetical protein